MNRILRLLRALLLLGMALLTSLKPACADTILPDTLRPEVGHTYFMTPEGSPYIGNVLTFIRRGDTLLVEAGTVALFGTDGGLVVLGTMISRGDATQLVRFTRNPSISTNWEGIKISPLNIPSDTTRCDFQYTKFTLARTAVTTTQRAVPEGEQHCVSFNHCAFDSSSLGVVCYLPGRYQIQNCAFNEIRYFCIFTNESIVDIRNNVFMPSSNLPTYAHGILLWNASWTPNDYIQYNCFYSGQYGEWINYIETYVDGDSFYTRVDPDSTHLFTNPMLDVEYYPQAGSPLIDAGDPALLDPDGSRSDMGMFTWQESTLDPPAAPRPLTLSLAAFPNPFNPSTTLRYQLADPGPARLEIFDLAGRRVALLIDGEQAAGGHEIHFDARGLPSGLYFAELEASGRRALSRLLLLR